MVVVIEVRSLLSLYKAYRKPQRVYCFKALRWYAQRKKNA